MPLRCGSRSRRLFVPQQAPSRLSRPQESRLQRNIRHFLAQTTLHLEQTGLGNSVQLELSKTRHSDEGDPSTVPKGSDTLCHNNTTHHSIPSCSVTRFRFLISPDGCLFKKRDKRLPDDAIHSQHQRFNHPSESIYQQNISPGVLCCTERTVYTKVTSTRLRHNL